MTLLDNDGFFYVIGGDVGVNNSTLPRTPVNDVWRSSFSLNDPASLSRMCNVSIPICGPGLRCLPGANTRIVNGRVTCPATDLCTSTRLGFNVLTSSAQWSIRHTAGLEITTAAVSAGGTNYAAGSLVVFGGVGYNATTNDFNALLTDTFVSSNGATWAQVSATGFAGAVGSAHCTDSKGRLYKVGGERDGVVVNDVWMSANTGRTWTKQTPSSSSKVFVARAYADVYADSSDALFLVGGRLYGFTAAGMNDVWMSINYGRDWTRQGTIPFGAAGGRFSASLLISYSKLLRKDVMTYIGGYSRLEGGGMDRYYNDVWVSQTSGKQWTRLTAASPFVEVQNSTHQSSNQSRIHCATSANVLITLQRCLAVFLSFRCVSKKRDNFNAEVTKDGYLVVVGGYNSREALNDGQQRFHPNIVPSIFASLSQSNLICRHH